MRSTGSAVAAEHESCSDASNGAEDGRSRANASTARRWRLVERGAAVALARVGFPQAGAGFDALSETGQAPAVRSRARCRNGSEEAAQTRA